MCVWGTSFYIKERMSLPKNVIVIQCSTEFKKRGRRIPKVSKKIRISERVRYYGAELLK